MDDIKDNAGGSAAVIIEPPAGSGVPVDSTPTPPVDVVDKTKPAGGDGQPVKPTVKLPASIKPPAKPTGRFQGRISELVGQRDAAARERDMLKAENAKMRGVVKPGDTTGGDGTKSTAKTGDEPLNPEDYATYGEYVAAQVEYTLNKKLEAQKSETANAAYESHKAERKAAFDEQAQPLSEEYGDGFWEAITDPTLAVSEAMVDAIMELDNLGPYIMLYLAAHRDEALKVAKMNPRAATVAIGKLWAKLDMEINKGEDGSGAAATGGGDNAGAGGGAGQSQASQPIQAAPKPSPVPTPRGSSAPAGDAAPKDTDSVDEWLKKETDRLRRQNPNGRFYGAR
jgi:hypothetical protein